AADGGEEPRSRRNGRLLVDAEFRLELECRLGFVDLPAGRSDLRHQHSTLTPEGAGPARSPRRKVAGPAEWNERARSGPLWAGRAAGQAARMAALPSIAFICGSAARRAISSLACAAASGRFGGRRLSQARLSLIAEHTCLSPACIG